DGANDGIVHRNLLASYAHLRGVQGDGWPSRFVAHVRQCRLSRSKPVPGEIAARPTLQHAEVT
ncbi:MAG: hypothetical protein OEY03_11110, partial [Rhizobacter sp.]|nr:hypothetical protein [Rhizobacter sp.]